MGRRQVQEKHDDQVKGFVPVEVDFQNQDNEDFVKMYYRRKLMEILSKHPELIFYPSDYMSDIPLAASFSYHTRPSVVVSCRIIR